MLLHYSSPGELIEAPTFTAVELPQSLQKGGTGRRGGRKRRKKKPLSFSVVSSLSRQLLGVWFGLGPEQEKRFLPGGTVNMGCLHSSERGSEWS